MQAADYLLMLYDMHAAIPGVQSMVVGLVGGYDNKRVMVVALHDTLVPCCPAHCQTAAPPLLVNGCFHGSCQKQHLLNPPSFTSWTQGLSPPLQSPPNRSPRLQCLSASMLLWNTAVPACDIYERRGTDSSRQQLGTADRKPLCSEKTSVSFRST